MKESGLTTKLKERELFGTQKVTYTLGSSKLTKLMDLVFTPTSMVQDMKENGSMMFKKVRAKKLG
jgi:hypothetical protein